MKKTGRIRTFLMSHAVKAVAMKAEAKAMEKIARKV
jgi:hypothetical protein